jgi:hypothetical protein
LKRPGEVVRDRNEISLLLLKTRVNTPRRWDRMGRWPIDRLVKAGNQVGPELMQIHPDEERGKFGVSRHALRKLDGNLQRRQLADRFMNTTHFDPEK